MIFTKKLDLSRCKDTKAALAELQAQVNRMMERLEENDSRIQKRIRELEQKVQEAGNG